MGFTRSYADLCGICRSRGEIDASIRWLQQEWREDYFLRLSFLVCYVSIFTTEQVLAKTSLFWSLIRALPFFFSTRLCREISLHTWLFRSLRLPLAWICATSMVISETLDLSLRRQFLSECCLFFFFHYLRPFPQVVSLSLIVFLEETHLKALIC